MHRTYVRSRARKGIENGLFVTRCVNASRKYVRAGPILHPARGRAARSPEWSLASERIASEPVVKIQYSRPAAILKSTAMQI